MSHGTWQRGTRSGRIGCTTLWCLITGFPERPCCIRPWEQRLILLAAWRAPRGLSLILMLGVTAMVYFAARGCWAAGRPFLASAFFAVLGLVVHYGAFATYDALALFFLVLGTWAAVHVREGGYRWIAGCAVALVASNAAKYATLAWVPLVVGIVVLHCWDKGVAGALRRACALAVSVAVLDVGLLADRGATLCPCPVCHHCFPFCPLGRISALPQVCSGVRCAMTGVLVLPAALGPIVSAVRRNPLPLTCLLGLPAAWRLS